MKKQHRTRWVMNRGEAEGQGIIHYYGWARGNLIVALRQASPEAPEAVQVRIYERQPVALFSKMAQAKNKTLFWADHLAKLPYLRGN